MAASATMTSPNRQSFNSDPAAPMFLPLGHRKVHDVLSLQFCVTYPAANRNSEKAQMPGVRFGHAGAALEPLRPAR
jgi:hypothetical protein